MPICYVCNYTSLDLVFFRTHLRTHGISSDDEVRCVEGRCKNLKKEDCTFSTLASFTRHYSRLHAEEIPEANDRGFSHPVTNDNCGGADVFNSNSEDEVEMMSDEDVDLFIVLNKLQKDMKFNLLRIISQLYGLPSLVRKQVQLIVEFIELLVNDSMACLNSVILDVLNKCVNSNFVDVNLVNEVFSVFKEPLKQVRTEHMRLKLFEEMGTYIPPKDITITTQLTLVNDEGQQEFRNIKLDAHFIAPSKILGAFLRQPGVLKTVFDYINSLSSEQYVVSNYMQGSQYRSLKGDGKKYFPIGLYNDEVEIRNGLGSHSSLHKLTKFYIVLLFLPPEYRSLLDNIFLVFSYHSADRTNTDPEKLYACLIKDFESLAVDGINFKLEDFEGKIYFNLALMMGDNIGLQSVTGFVESPSANFPSRFCKATKEQVACDCEVRAELLRLSSLYDEDVALANPSQTGVNKASPWNKLPVFHVNENVSVDAMHDLLEGVVKYDLEFLLQYYLNAPECKLDLTTLNNRILGFDYGSDIKNKPVPISPAPYNEVKVRMSASETLVFVTFFGLLIGDYVPRDEPHWQLYLLLRKILDILLRPCIVEGYLHVLKDLIHDHNELYLSLSDDNTLKLKFHLLLHYVSLIEKFGPVIHFWCMRCEARHRIAKLIAAGIFSNQNLGLSISIRNQLLLHSVLFENAGLKRRLKSGKTTAVTLSTLPQFYAFRGDIPLNGENEVYNCAESMKLFGTKYREGMVLVVDYAEDSPKFGIVKHVLEKSGKIFFVCNRLETCMFDTHFHCYKVNYTHEFTFISQEKLAYVHPTVLINSPVSDDLYIPYKFGI